MMIAIPEKRWTVFRTLTHAALAKLLCRLRLTTTFTGLAYRLMAFLFRRSSDARRSLQRRIRRREDLDLSLNERAVPSLRDIVPQSLEFHKKERQWTPDKLLKAGRHLSKKLGGPNPPIERQMELGLLEAAWSTPSKIEDLSAEEIQNLIRLSLFGLN